MTLKCSVCAPQPGYLSLLHYLGAAISFTCICFYTVLLTELTRKCVLTGYEKVLYPLRVISTVLQIIVTICCILFFVLAEHGVVGDEAGLVSVKLAGHFGSCSSFGSGVLLCLQSGTDWATEADKD